MQKSSRNIGKSREALCERRLCFLLSTLCRPDRLGKEVIMERLDAYLICFTLTINSRDGEEK